MEGSNKYWLHRFRLLQDFHFYWFWSEEKEAISQKDHCNRCLAFFNFHLRYMFTALIDYLKSFSWLLWYLIWSIKLVNRVETKSCTNWEMKAAQTKTSNGAVLIHLSAAQHNCFTFMFNISVIKQLIPTTHFYVRIKLREKWTECGNLPGEQKTRWVTWDKILNRPHLSHTNRTWTFLSLVPERHRRTFRPKINPHTWNTGFHKW